MNKGKLVQLVNFDNGSELMRAAVIPLGVALEILNIQPKNQKSKDQIAYVRLIGVDILDYYSHSIAEFIEDIKYEPSIFQFRISFFVDSTDHMITNLRNVNNINDLNQYIDKFSPKQYFEIQDISSINLKTKVITLSYTPSKKRKIQLIYSGINNTDKIPELFVEIYHGYSRYVSTRRRIQTNDDESSDDSSSASNFIFPSKFSALAGGSLHQNWSTTKECGI